MMRRLLRGALVVAFALVIGCWDARADTLTAVGFIGVVGGDLIDFSHKAFTFTFEFDPTIVGVGTTGVSSSHATIGGYEVTGSGGYIVGGVSSYVAVDKFHHSVSGDLIGDLFPYFVEIENGKDFTVSFATRITPDVAFGVQRIHGTIDSFSAPDSPTPVPEPSTWALLSSGLLAVVGIYRKRLH